MNTQNLDKSGICFIILHGFASDPDPLKPIKSYLEKIGCAAIATNFWGDGVVSDFSKLRIEPCIENLDSLVKKVRSKCRLVVGVGISLGGSILIEYAKNHSELDYIVSVGTPFRLKNRKLISIGLFLLPIINPVWNLIDKIKILRLPPIGASKTVVNFLERQCLENLDKVKTPLLFLHSCKDPIADYRAVGEYAEKILNAPKKIILFENGSHEINYDSETICENIMKFVGLTRNVNRK